MTERQAGAKELAELVPCDVMHAVARDLSLGLDCNVPLMACQEAVVVLFLGMKEAGFSILPPGSGLA